MKKLEELGISPAPWSAKQDSGYDRESGDFNSSDIVCDAIGKVIADWWNGETYGEVHPNAEADAFLIAAAPELYEALLEALPWLSDIGEEVVGNESARKIAEVVKKIESALKKASGEST